MQEYLDGLVDHLALEVLALAIFPARILLIRAEKEGLSRLILVIVDDLGYVFFRDYDSPVGVGGLHYVCLNNNVIGNILEVSVEHTEVFGLQIYSQGVIQVGIVPVLVHVVCIISMDCAILEADLEVVMTKGGR